jgi:hypothetical protein
MQEYEKRTERLRRTEAEMESLRAFTETFVNRWDCYPLQQFDGKYLCVKSPLTLEMVDKHLRSQMTIGAYALTEQNEASWLVLDADEECEWETLIRMHVDLLCEDIRTYLERSRRGGHLWFFPEVRMTGADVRRVGKTLLDRYNLQGLEIYPRQDVLRTGVGSLIRLPLGVHQAAEPKRIFPFVKADMSPLAPTPREQFAMIAHPERIPLEWLRQTASLVPEPKRVSSTPSFEMRKMLVSGDTVSERIKNAISVRDFVSRYIDLDKSGMGLCPFHDDHQVSFGVKESGDFWHCFACEIGGSVIDFWMRWRQLHGQDWSFRAAVKELAAILL